MKVQARSILSIFGALLLTAFHADFALAKNTNPNTPRPIIDKVVIDADAVQLIIFGTNLFDVDVDGVPRETPNVVVGGILVPEVDTLPDATSDGTVVRVNFEPAANMATAFVLSLENSSGSHTVDVTAGAVAAAQDENDALQADLEAQIAAEAAASQDRVIGICPTGSSIRVINQDGTVSCENDSDTTYTSGFGLELVGTTLKRGQVYELRLTGNIDTKGSNLWLTNSGFETFHPLAKFILADVVD